MDVHDVNIVLLSHSFLPTVGGRELVVHHLAKALTELGETVRVVGPGGLWSQRGWKLGYPVVRFPRLVRFGGKARRGPAAMLREAEFMSYLAAAIRFRGADVIHAHSTYPAGYLVERMLGRDRSTPVVITPHGNDINVIPELGHGMRLDAVLARKIDYALHHCDRMTAISAGIHDEAAALGLGVEKMVMVPNGVDTGRFQGISRHAAREHLGIGHKEKVLIAVGNNHPRKGHADLILAMRDIVAHVAGIRLVLVGNRVESLRPMVEELGLAGHVQLEGAAPFPLTQGGVLGADRLATLYAAADVYLSGAKVKGAEGLSLALLEALAAGLPAVVTDVSGAGDIVQHGINGYLVKGSDPAAMAERTVALLQSDAVERMGEAARCSVQGFDWLSVAKQYMEVYRSVSAKVCNQVA